MASSPKDFQVNGPEWAKGCEHCEYGILSAPEILGQLTLSEQRAVANDEGMILFCECRAAFMYRQFCRKTFSGLGLETRRNIREHLANHAPTIHMAGEPAVT